MVSSMNPDIADNPADEESPYPMFKLLGRCRSGCGCEVRRWFRRFDLVSGLDVTWCRRCQAYTLFDWWRI
jgi:hypothetical protein